MIGIFKQKNPGNAFLLLIYGLVLKFPIFLHPESYAASDGNSYIFQLVIRFLKPVTDHAPIVFPLLTFLMLFMQATLLNRISNTLRLFPKANYLVGMSYLLITSLMHEWNLFSAPLLVNFLLIWSWYRMTNLYNNNSPKTAIFNISLLLGLLPLIYSPAVVFLLLIIFVLLITRPFYITEWLVALIGFTTPYYFLFVVLYLTGQWDWAKVIPPIHFNLPKLSANLWVTGGVVFMVLPFLIGSYYTQSNLNKMLIQTRKSWSLLLVLLMVSVVIILVNPGVNYLHWLPVIVPLSVFNAAAYYYPNGRWFPLLLHWIVFLFAIALNYNVRL
ncbi:MAG: hypothetical protein JST39_19635 [Bacteroidetes bacterium]|nr:hypothetical protein [Bacteroidota bacterium]